MFLAENQQLSKCRLLPGFWREFGGAVLVGENKYLRSLSFEYELFSESVNTSGDMGIGKAESTDLVGEACTGDLVKRMNCLF